MSYIKDIKDKKKMLCRLHPDFHTPADAIVGKDFDAADYIAKTKAAHIDSQVFFAKCCYGFSYYPTEVGTVHPGLQCDMLGEIAKECKKQNVRLVVYESLFLDSEAAKQHPDWRPKSDPNPFKERDDVGRYAPICVNSDYLEKLFIPQTLEVIRKYHPDELFFDTMCNFDPCYCDNCKKKFGEDIPENDSDPRWSEYVAWYNECYDEFFKKITDAVYTESPETEITFNWKWAAGIPATPIDNIRRVAGDLHPLASEASYNTRYWASTGVEYEYMCGRFMHGLGDWTTNTYTTLKSVASAAVANGAGYYMIDRQLPNGTLEKRAWKTANEVFSYLDKKRPFLEGAYHAHEIAVLFSLEHIVGPNLEFFPDKEKRKYQAEVFRGISEILRVNGIHYTATNEDNLIKDINTYKLIILPETQFVRADLRDALEQYVANGGRLLLINCNDKNLLSLAGAELLDTKTSAECEFVYIRDAEWGKKIDSNMDNDPFIVKGGMQILTANKNASDDISRYPSIIMPMSAGDDSMHYGNGLAPSGEQTDNPAFIINKEKTVGAISIPIVRWYHQYREPNLANYVINRINDLLPEKMVTLETPALVETALLRQENDLIINLVNHSGREYLAGYWCPVVEYMPTITGAKLRLGAECLNACSDDGNIIVEDCDTGEIHEFNVKAATSECTDCCETDISNKYVEFEVPGFDIMHSFRVKNVFAN